MNRDDTIALFRAATTSGVGDLFSHAIGFNLTMMKVQHELDYDTTGAIYCAMANELRPIAVVQKQDAQPAAPSVESAGPARDQNVSLRSDPAEVGEVDRKNFLMQYHVAAASAAGYLRDLVACHQVSALNASNIENYFMAQNGTRVRGVVILKLLNVARNLFPKLIELEEVRDNFTDIEFIKYHTNYSSSAGLVKRFLDDTAGLFVLSDATTDAINRAYELYWDREASNAIPTKVKAMTRAYLEAIDALPSNWYQGKKAMEAISPVKYRTYLAFFKQFGRLTSGADDIARAATIDELLATLPAGDRAL